MRIGLNLLFLLPGVSAGVATYARGILTGLARVGGGGHRYFVFLNRESAGFALPQTGCFERVVCDVRAVRREARYAYEQVWLPVLVARLRLDVLHSLSYVSPLLVPCPSVVTIHDANFRAFGNRLGIRRRLLLPRFIRSAAARAARIITVSEFSRIELISALSLRNLEKRIEVIPEAPDPVLVEELNSCRESKLPAPFPSEYALTLNIGGPNKNAERLLRVWAQLGREGLALPLVVAGHPPPCLNREPASSLLADGLVHPVGFLTARRLAAYLRRARIFVFPSLYEGFGLPVLEAMVAGVPVVCSGSTAVKETAGDAALAFDPESESEMYSAIVKILRDACLRERLVQLGLSHVAKFSWELAASRTVAVYERVGSEASRD